MSEKPRVTIAMSEQSREPLNRIKDNLKKEFGIHTRVSDRMAIDYLIQKEDKRITKKNESGEKE